jgi:hypothetical protein
MTRNELAEHVEDLFATLYERLTAKNEDYATPADGLASFHRASDALSLPRETVLLVHATKHQDRVARYVREHTTSAEDVLDSIGDVIIYHAILHAMIEEKL